VSALKDFVEYSKSLWGLISLISISAGPGGTFLVPIIPDYARSCGSWAFFFSLLSAILFFSSWKNNKRLSSSWSLLPVMLLVLTSMAYTFLLDYLPRTVWPTGYPDFSRNTVGVVYGLIFGFLTSAFGVLAISWSRGDRGLP